MESPYSTSNVVTSRFTDSRQTAAVVSAATAEEPAETITPPTPTSHVAWVATSAIAPTSGTSLAVARIAFGAIGVLSAVRLFARGWVGTLFADPEVHLRYPGLGWVPVPPSWAIPALVVLIGLAALAIATGWRFRIAVVVFVVAFSWLELVEVTVYLNHYWFMTLAGALFAFLPMSARWSLDARRRGPADVPRLAVWMVRAQVGVVYTLAGIAKLNGDWLAHGLPLAMWLPARSHLPGIGPLLAERSTAFVASWAGALFDCTVVALLSWRRTRAPAFCAVVAFHLITWWLFPIIGVFPWLMIAMATIFFEPDWPERTLGRARGTLRRIRSHRGARVGATDPLGVLALLERSDPLDRPPVAGAALPVVGAAGPVAGETLPVAGGTWWRRHSHLTAAAVCLWAFVQLGLPLRHMLYPSDHRWSGEGMRFGWNVMLIEKAGAVTFRIEDPQTGERWSDDASGLLTPQQLRVMRTDPELMRQTAHLLADQRQTDGFSRPRVRVDAMVSHNGRPAAPMVDPRVDLAAEPWRLGSQSWILPVPTAPPPG